MSQFSFPRIHFHGLLSINVGTGNNNDYSSYKFPPDSPNAGKLLRQTDTMNVQANSFGMTDEEWLEWAQTTHNFVPPPPRPSRPCPPESATVSTINVKPPIDVNKATNLLTHETEDTIASIKEELKPLIPGEWNYYGDMTLSMKEMKVTGIDLPNGIIDAEMENALVGKASLSFNNRPDSTGRTTAMMIDVNAESVPNSQVFADNLLLQLGDEILLSGKPTKAATRWINFQRNIGLNGSAGASATFQCVVPLEDIQNEKILTFIRKYQEQGKVLKGVTFRYNMSRSIEPISNINHPNNYFDAIEALYRKKGMNPKIAEIIGTIAPWYEGELESVTMGRQLVPKGSFLNPNFNQGTGNGCMFSLCPTVLKVNEELQLISLDLANTFPEDYQNLTPTTYDPNSTTGNPKVDLGTVTLKVTYNGQTYDVGEIDYSKEAYVNHGGMVDISMNNLSPTILEAITNGDFQIYSSEVEEPLLEETPFMVVSDQGTIYCDQSTEPVDEFIYDNGVKKSQVGFTIFYRGQPFNNDNPAVTNFQLYGQEFKTTPNQSAPIFVQNKAYKLNGKLELTPDEYGNRLFFMALVYTINEETIDQRVTVDDLNLNTSALISLRVLPTQDFSEYYQDPSAKEVKGNDKLTFDVVYKEVLQNYYLLYPAMNTHVPLNNPDFWASPDMAKRLMNRTSLDHWDSAIYMPRTRDLSANRRELIHAWCRKIIYGNDPVV